ncbi:MAG TPA: hypothetical protein VIH28_07100 [Ignavibacteriaceae bacterium]
MLFEIIRPLFTFSGELNTLQTQTWQKVCTKAETSPKDLTPLEAFQMGKFTERAIQRNIEFGGAEMEDETKFLKDLQTSIKIALL